MDLSTSTRAADGLNEWTAPRPKLDGKSALDHLFNRLDGMYPGKWRKEFTTPQSIENWKEECARVFMEEGITLNQVADGLRVCRRKYMDWPPSVPQLAEACNPSIDAVAAYHEAIAGLEARGKGEMGMWSHPAIYWAASKLARDLASQPSQFIKERWAAALKSQLARGTWDEIPPPRLQLPAPGKSATSSEDAARELAKLGALGIIKKKGCKQWAQDFLDKHAAGSKAVTKLQLREARIALEIDNETEDEYGN